MTKDEAIKILDWIPTKGDEVDAIEMAIEALSCSEEPNRSDTIYRQDVIDMIQGVPISSGTTKAMLIFRAKELPSAPTEPLTDKEQRIFLAAMERERKVCKQVDEEWRDGELGELYETVNLERVCNEIERKVKGALWTI